jgi:hypothetical protein
MQFRGSNKMGAVDLGSLLISGDVLLVAYRIDAMEILEQDLPYTWLPRLQG